MFFITQIRVFPKFQTYSAHTCEAACIQNAVENETFIKNIKINLFFFFFNNNKTHAQMLIHLYINVRCIHIW